MEPVYKATLEAERKSNGYRSIELERRKTIISKSGTKAEMDIYWQFEQAAIIYTVTIEYKNEKRNVRIAATSETGLF